ncbi:MAG: methylated-DNA--[protein]-cysteine S-methyltransferase [Actinobacteria bacterium]|nr:methylated-DNA--[protein]-cysteine S-methyltransferase [Actinomycetota bacterium]
MLAVTTILTPWVPLTVIADDDCVVSSWFGEQSHHPIDLVAPIGKARRIDGVSDAVAAWLDGDLRGLDQVKVRQNGGQFFEQVWTVMREVSAGETVTYGELAMLAGRPRASRAVGTACATNSVAPFVPCHRVVPAGGGIGAYGYGVAVKEALLRHEGAI